MTPQKTPVLKNFESFRIKRRDLGKKLFTNRDLFMAGLFMTGIFLFNPSTLLKTLQFLFFWFLAWLGGKKNNPFITLGVMAGIVLFNLLAPYGKVLAILGPFCITQGSLLSGLNKAVTLEGLIMLSKTTIREDLQLPGFIGGLLGEAFRILEGINRRKGKITRKHFIEDLDDLLVELSTEQEKRDQLSGGSFQVKAMGTASHEVESAPGRNVLGLLLLTVAAVLTAVLTILPETKFLNWAGLITQKIISLAGGAG
jgi:heptaprenyl diphosphate synthase